MLNQTFLYRLGNDFKRIHFYLTSRKMKTNNANKEQLHGTDKYNQRKKTQQSVTVFQYASNKSSNNRIYGWGFAESGALGVKSKQTTTQIIKNPVRLSFGEKHEINDIACGFGFTVYAVKTKSKLYGSGINTDSQIGYHELKRGIPSNLIATPMPIDLVSESENLNVLKVSAGRAHVLILTTEGLFTLGNNAYGQCARKIVNDENYAQRCITHHIPNINDQKIIGVQCGQDHSLLITEKGEVYACGWGADGQTGLGHNKTESSFTHVLGDIDGEVITKLACTADCVLALNDKGEIFGWGNSEYGQLFHNSDTQQITVPIKLKYDIGKITDIAVGGSFCMALNEEGHVYAWGYGLLGNGYGVQHSFTPVLIPPAFFNNSFQPDSKVVSLCCGIGHMGAITNLGDFYVWGKNRQGCLGLGHLNNQHFPLKVAISASVQKVSCGLDHNIALCRPFI